MSGQPTDTSDHYFSVSPHSPERRFTFDVSGPWGDLVLESTTGIFSSTGLDKGTQVLLDYFSRHPPQSPPDGSVLVDLGCGSGAIALVLASMYPACAVKAIDVNDRALEICASNARSNGVTNVECLHPDEFDPAVRIHFLMSNPPVRIGKTQMHDMLLTWLTRLTADGTAELVVGRHLGADSLMRWLSEQGLTVAKRASSRGFRVIEVRPGSSPTR